MINSNEPYLNELLKRPVWFIFLLSWLFYLIGLFLFSQMVWDSNTYLSDHKGDDFETFIAVTRRIDLLRYVLSPVWVMCISAVIWLIVKLGLVIAKVEFNAALLFKIIFLGFIIISLQLWIKSVWLILFKSGYTPDDVKYFFPGSFISFIDTSQMNLPAIKAIANFDLFHLLFIVFTSWEISQNSVLNYFKSFNLVLFTYGFGLAIYQSIVLYFAL